MVLKSECEHCAGHLEFDNEGIGQMIRCPHCGKETILQVKPQSTPPPVAPSPPAAKRSSNLITCGDCGHVLSVNADACPNCGASFKRKHGVFYYVFWGVVSLFVTLGILLVGLLVLGIGLPAFFVAKTRVQQQAGSEPQIVQTETPRTEASRTEIASTNFVSTAPVEVRDEKREYIRNNIILYDTSARYFESSLDGWVPGVKFKIRNAGTRTLKDIRVNVIFYDAGGRAIAEEDYLPVNSSAYSRDDSRPLKPNYIWQMERGRFYTAKHVPTEWKEGAAILKITDIEFLDE